MPNMGGSAKCGKCGKSVYFAEEMVVAGKKWHKMCVKCEDCNKMLDSFTVKDHEGVLYCSGCHGKNFGLKGYGYGGGAGVLSTGGAVGSKPTSETAYQPAGKGAAGGSRFGGADKCPRCSKSVYAAEKIIGAGQSWHKGCFNCITCNKKLDSTTMCDKEGEIYCKSCYGKKFGPKGYGFGGGAGTLVNTE
ncbi:cysteine and glycine-rich protein 1-like [Patiria miniata]|uniref:LIM zinc-binding domain-containing protein n=1 Tax=Patiria miniata TaxID=46514 RepID=A0A914BIZ7_PATMI|nr:cysteine and glycine-rich protein 1-like [Patiria miniata]XP_038075407.1 cysteine and glycine-rich protein 1-like [Patiria miniata]